MPAAIAMATTKPVLPSLSKASATSLSFSAPSSSSSNSSSVSTISIPVSAFHDPSSNVITITPYIFVKTATVAEQMQALRQDKKIGKAPEQPAGALRVKRRADLSKLGLPEAKPASVSRRNARERNRVKQVNLGFETLREHVPNGKKNKKMSKVQTLRTAAQYIKDLYMILHGELPALGSPSNLIDDHEPDSPLDNSVCSMSDNDTDMGVSSPETKAVQMCHFMQHPSRDTPEPTSLPPSPTVVYTQQVSQSSPKPVFPQQSSQSSPKVVFNQQVSQSSPNVAFNQVSQSPSTVVFSQQVSQSPSTVVFSQQVSQSSPTSSTQRQKAQPLILKKENISVLQQQLTRGLISQPTRGTSVLKQQLQSQQQLQPQQQQIQRQLQKQEHDQIRMALCQDQKPNFDLSPVRVVHLAGPANLALSNNVIKSFLNANSSTTAFAQLSPVSLAEEPYDNAMDMSPDTKYDNAIDLSPDTTGSEHDADPSGFVGNSSMDVPPSPPTLHSYSNDFNMNRIDSQADFNLLQSYYKSIRHEHLKSIDPSFIESRGSSHMGVFHGTAGLSMVHSPAPSLCSTTSTGSSETDGSVHSSYDYDNVDKEALLDISNWISELCQATHANDLGQN